MQNRFYTSVQCQVLSTDLWFLFFVADAMSKESWSDEDLQQIKFGESETFCPTQRNHVQHKSRKLRRAEGETGEPDELEQEFLQ